MKAVLYARVSTKDKEQEPEVQLRARRPWVTARGWTGEYTDKVTGDEARRRRDPPGLSQAMQQLEQHRAKVLAIYSAERLVRSPLGILRIVARVEQMGCHVASLQDGGDLDTTSDTGELLLFLRGWHSRMALRMLRKSTVDGMEEARGRGVVLGRPLGELPDPEQVRALMSAGLGRRRVAKALGVTEWAVRQALIATLDTSQTVYEILENPPPAALLERLGGRGGAARVPTSLWLRGDAYPDSRVRQGGLRCITPAGSLVDSRGSG